MIAFSHKEHYTFAIMLWGYLYFSKTIEHINLLVVIFASLLPDADIRKSPMGKVLPLWLFFNHRGFTHTIPCTLLLTYLAYWLTDWNIALSFFIGYMSHLMLDALTPMGIKWWFGHGKRKKKWKK